MPIGKGLQRFRRQQNASPVRAVLFSPSWPAARSYNGVVTYVNRLAAALAELGVDVRILAGRVDDDMQLPARAAGVVLATDERNTVGHYAQNRLHHLLHADAADTHHVSWRIGRALRRMAEARSFDLYEIEEAFGHGPRLLGRAPGRQVVRLHGPWFLCAPALGLSTASSRERTRIEDEGRAIEHAHAVSSPSLFALEAVRARYGLSLQRAVVIPNPTAVVPEERGWTRERAVPESILFVGRFDRLKGADTVIEAFGRVHARRPDARLTFVGPDRGMPDGAGGTLSFEQFLTRSLGPAARARVDFLGPLSPERIEGLRASAAVTVVASRFETFGMTVVEAMAAGSPLVAASAGGVSEVIGYARDALSFEPGSAAHLSSRLNELFDDPARAAALGARGREEATRRYAPEVVARATARFYAEIVGRPA